MTYSQAYNYFTGQRNTQKSSFIQNICFPNTIHKFWGNLSSREVYMKALKIINSTETPASKHTINEKQIEYLQKRNTYMKDRRKDQ